MLSGRAKKDYAREAQAVATAPEEASGGVLNAWATRGEYSDEKTIDPAGPSDILPILRARTEVPAPYLRGDWSQRDGKVHCGASPSGRAAKLRVFRHRPPLAPEFDTPEDGYQAFLDLGLRVAKHISQAGRPVVLMAGGLPTNSRPRLSDVTLRSSVPRACLRRLGTRRPPLGAARVANVRHSTRHHPGTWTSKWNNGRPIAA
jgi:hypothetical protein